MTLHFIPTTPNAASMIESEGDEQAVRAHAANVLRCARANGAKPRLVRDSVLTRIYKLSNGLLKLCL